jgi:hypothetical protein
MKKSILFTFLSLFIFVFAIQAQNAERYSSTRLNNLANQLKRQTVDLADRTSENLKGNNSNTRGDIEAAFLAQQLDASAGLFQQMVNDRSRASDLRDASAILSDLARRAPSYGSNSNLWRDAQRTVGDIERELGSGNGTGTGIGIDDGIGDSTGNVAGRAYWKGTVDSKIQISIQGKGLGVRTISGADYGNGTYNLTSPLARRNVTVDVIKKKGRGDVRVIQQPSRDNGYTAIVEITDNDGGAREYELEIYWK